MDIRIGRLWSFLLGLTLAFGLATGTALADPGACLTFTSTQAFKLSAPKDSLKPDDPHYGLRKNGTLEYSTKGSSWSDFIRAMRSKQCLGALAAT